MFVFGEAKNDFIIVELPYTASFKFVSEKTVIEQTTIFGNTIRQIVPKTMSQVKIRYEAEVDKERVDKLIKLDMYGSICFFSDNKNLYKVILDVAEYNNTTKTQVKLSIYIIEKVF